METKPMNPFEVIETPHIEVKCDGIGAALGHPRVFLHIDIKNGQIQCPYCSRLYVFKGDEPLRDTGVKVAV